MFNYPTHTTVDAFPSTFNIIRKVILVSRAVT